MQKYEAVVVGAGPNGLAAAIMLAQAGWSVLLVEANETVGGAARSSELTLPGFIHDLGSSIHPLGIGSPFFRGLPLERYGLRWIHAPLPLAHPLDGGRAAVQHRSLEQTAVGLGVDAGAYRRLMEPLAKYWTPLIDELLRPILHVPRRPLLLARFGLQAIRSARAVADSWFKGDQARALLAGHAGHSMLALEELASASFGLLLGVAGHTVGWPMPAGGAQAITNALAACFIDLGGEIRTGFRVHDLDELPPAKSILLDVTPRQFLRIAGKRLPDGYRRRLEKFRYGMGVFKVDFALDAPIPWVAEACRQAGTVHIGGTFEEVAEAERAVASGQHPERPFVLLAQHSLFDATRAPEGKHTAWAYCHVPLGSTLDMTEAIESQIERFAPGFQDGILSRYISTPTELERQNANLVGGSINGGAMDLPQLLARPTLSLNPYRTPLDGVYLCSSSTPPGAGVHGMCGYWAARAALRGV